MTEKVYVVPAYALQEITRDSVIAALSTGYFYERDKAETNENLKQIIPYVTVTRFDGKILAYKRSKKAGEGRLHNKWSIGFGGHVNPIDLQGVAKDEFSFFAAINRELTEELEWGDKLAENGLVLTLDKVIYDDSNEVGRVHLGLAFSVILQGYYGDEDPKIGDDEIAELKWVTVEEALELENLENWSKLALNKTVYE